MIKIENHTNSAAYKTLVKRYAGDKKLCNCREAYYSEGGECSRQNENGIWETHYDALYCKGGCNANQYRTLDHVCEQVCKELV